MDGFFVHGFAWICVYQRLSAVSSCFRGFFPFYCLTKAIRRFLEQSPTLPSLPELTVIALRVFCG
jgi:hypothetical protein